MSPKSKLGRNPFESASHVAPGAPKKKAAKPKRAAGAGAGAAKVETGAPRRKREPRNRTYRRSRRRRPPGFTELLQELTHYWIPRIKACAYVRAVKATAKIF